VAPVVRQTDWQHLPLPHDKHELFQTRRSVEELRAYPEHVNAAAYARLREAIYPWTLPFDLWTEEIRAYLDQLGTSRSALIEAVRPPASGTDPSAVAIAGDTLDLTTAAWDAIADTSSDRMWAGWGVPAAPLGDDLSHMRAFLERTGMTHAE